MVKYHMPLRLSGENVKIDILYYRYYKQFGVRKICKILNQSIIIEMNEYSVVCK